jgi:alkylhydroperoxidase/carboxymuconolactone decarboxylase family protein YurZ
MPDPQRDPTGFRAKFKEQKDQGKISEALRMGLVGAFAPLRAYAGVGKSAPQQYAEALEQAFYADGNRHPGQRLTAKDRERVLIPLLASRSDDFALAVHVYLGWLEGLDEEEIGELLFLGGVYTGISHMTRGLEVAKRTFDLVYGEGPNTPFPAMLGKLKASFMPATPMTSPPPRGPGS